MALPRITVIATAMFLVAAQPACFSQRDCTLIIQSDESCSGASFYALTCWQIGDASPGLSTCVTSGGAAPPAGAITISSGPEPGSLTAVAGLADCTPGPGEKATEWSCRALGDRDGIAVAVSPSIARQGLVSVVGKQVCTTTSEPVEMCGK